MIDFKDVRTVRAFTELAEVVKGREKPLVFWVGAGVSSWCGYPTWEGLADTLHSSFARTQPTYDKTTGLELLTAQAPNFPQLFQLCKDTNSQAYYRLLAREFGPRQMKPVYQRFVDAVSSIQPTNVLTTNVDELLEKHLPDSATISRTNLERAADLLGVGQPFVCKLHGSISNVESMIFTTSEYDMLVADATYQALLQRILASATLVFVGYGLQEDYLLSLLSRNADINHLFGDGPHFAIVPDVPKNIPSTVRAIRYVTEPHRDHRSLIGILDEIRILKSQAPVLSIVQARPAANMKLRSSHLLFDIYPPGTWITAQAAEVVSAAGDNRQIIVGTGFVDSEIAKDSHSAMHDLMVGLLCFDQVYLPVSALSRVHDLLGSDLFWILVRDDAIVLLSWESQEAMMFPSVESIAHGDLLSFSHYKKADKTEVTFGEVIRNQLRPTPGREQVAQELFESLEKKIVEIKRSEEGRISDVVRSLLLRPSIRKILGVSDGTPLDSFTRWQVFPVLRLANIVKIGIACRNLGIASAKLGFGTALLAGPAFAATMGVEWTDEAAGYVLAGRYSADLGAIARRDPTVLQAIVAFRDTESGVRLRQEVLSKLCASEAAEVNLAINAGLKDRIPNIVLEEARHQFLELFVSQASFENPRPAVWNDSRLADECIARWRRRSQEILDQWCSAAKLGPYEPCPCGSGEKLRFCCGEALRL